MKGNNGAIETFRDFQEGGTQADFLRAAINSAHSNDQAGSKATFFESPYWPG